MLIPWDTLLFLCTLWIPGVLASKIFIPILSSLSFPLYTVNQHCSYITFVHLSFFLIFSYFQMSDLSVRKTSGLHVILQGITFSKRFIRFGTFMKKSGIISKWHNLIWGKVLSFKVKQMKLTDWFTSDNHLFRFFIDVFAN